MPFLLLLLILLVLLLGLCWPVRAYVCLRLCGGAFHFIMQYNVFFSMLPIRFAFYGEWKNPAAWQKLGWGRRAMQPLFTEKKKSRKGFLKGVPHLKKHVRLRALRCAGEIGVRENMAAAVMLTGLLRVSLAQLADTLGVADETALRPALTDGVCRVKLEGIFSLRAVHIIIAVLCDKRKERRGKKYAASH